MNYQEKIENILHTESLPHKFICAYAVTCAKDVFPLIKDKDLKEKSLHCIDLAERWIKGEDIKAKALSDAAYAAAYAATSATSAARAARAATYAARAATFAIDAAAYAATSAYAATHATNSAAYAHNKDYEYYYNLLISLIKQQLTPLERLIIFNKENI